MKTKLFLIVCLIMCLSWTNSNAQNKAKNAVQGWFESTYYTPVYCDGVMVDYLEDGVIKVHQVMRWVPGVSYMEIDQIKGEVTSETGEVFKINERDWWFYTDAWYVAWHFNLRGNWGSHYIGTIIQNYDTGEWIIGMAVCPDYESD